MIEFLISFWISYIPFSIWLYLIAKRADYWVPFFSFIPYLQYLVIFKIAWYWKWLAMIFVALSVAAVFNHIFIYVLIALLSFVIFQMWIRTLWSTWYSLLAAIFPPVWIFAIWLKLHNKTVQEEIENEHKRDEHFRFVECLECKNELKLPKEVKAKQWKCPKCWNIIKL